uniref:Putative pectate lyase n=1 Tax=viral metagenome TaxID=1070528 RepID=A0A6M3K3K7_9ZZZZ
MASGDPVIDGKTTDLMNYINVKASPYNALGNGTTNDTTAFNSAIAVANASGATLFIPAGRYLITPGGMTTITTNVDGPNAILQASTIASAALVSHYRWESNDIGAFFRLKGLYGYGASMSSYNPADHYGYGLNLGASHTYFVTYEIQNIIGFLVGVYLNGTQAGAHLATNEFKFQFVAGNYYGIYFNNGTGGVQPLESNRFTITYMVLNYINIYMQSAPDAAWPKVIVNNLFDIVCMELHQQDGDTGFYLAGSQVSGNVFKVHGSFVTGTGYAVVGYSAHNNRFELSYLPFNKIAIDAGNVFDQRTTETTYSADFAIYGRARSEVMDSAAPTVAYWRIGDICWNTNPASGVLLWVARANGVGAAANWGTVNIN